MKRISSILLFTGLCLNAFSQTPPTPKIGYYSRASAGVLTGDHSSMSVQVANGISLRHVDVGLGLGLEMHDQTGYTPIFIESRYNFGNGSTQPFAGICGGYLATLNNNMYNDPYRGGYTMGAQIGMTHYFSKHFGISTTLGYRFSFTNNTYPHWADVSMWSYYGQNVIWDKHRIEVRVGVHFR
jgi:hypothetical protein